MKNRRQYGHAQDSARFADITKRCLRHPAVGSNYFGFLLSSRFAEREDGNDNLLHSSLRMHPELGSTVGKQTAID